MGLQPLKGLIVLSSRELCPSASGKSKTALLKLSILDSLPDVGELLEYNSFVWLNRKEPFMMIDSLLLFDW